MFPYRLKALRKGSKLTLRHLAKQLNKNNKEHYSSSQIENWERGTRNPTYHSLNILAKYFNVSLDYLVGREYNDQIDLSSLLLSNKNLKFNQINLSNQDIKQVYALIQGYLFSNHRLKDNKNYINQQNQQLKLNLNNKG